MKKLICLVLIFTLMLTACSKWEIEIVDPTKPVEGESELIAPENEKEEKPENIPEEKPEDFSEEEIPAETEELTENDEPSVSDLAYISVSMDERLPLSEKQKELIEELLQTESWTDVPEDWEGKETEMFPPYNIFESDGRGTLYVGPEGENTLIMLKWGENQKYKKYYFAPEEVAYDIEIFREKIVFSKEISEEQIFTPEEFAEYQKKYLNGFSNSVPLWKTFDEENYFDGIYSYFLFSSAFYAYNGYDPEEDIEGADYVYPEEFVVDYIRKYFLWDAETIRKNAKENEFDEEYNTYFFFFGGGGGYYPPVISDVRQDGNTIEIDIEQYSAMDETNGKDFKITRFNTLTIRIDDDGTWKYLRNKVYYVGE